MASLCSKPTGLASLPGGEGGDLSVNCRPACHATGYLLLKQGRSCQHKITGCSKQAPSSTSHPVTERPSPSRGHFALPRPMSCHNSCQHKITGCSKQAPSSTSHPVTERPSPSRGHFALPRPMSCHKFMPA